MNSFFEKQKIKDFLTGTCLILLPLFILVFLSLLEKRPLFHVYPINSNDEIDYWREMFSFSQNGFDFGKYGWLGFAPAKYGSFGCHGLLQIFAWGWYCLLFGWNYNSIYIANFIMLTAAFALFVLIVRPDAKKCLLILLLSIGFRPLSIYLNTSLMEIPCFAAILLYFACMIRFQKDVKPLFWFIACIIVGLYCSLLRICYIVLLFPVILISNDFKIDLKLIIKMIVYVLVFLVIYLFYTNTTAQYPQWFLTDLADDPGLLNKLSRILAYFLSGVHAYFKQITDKMIWLYSSYASLSGIVRLLNDFPDLFFPIRLLNVLILIVLLLPKMRDRKWRFDLTDLSVFVMLLTFNIGIIALYDVSGWVDTRVISSLLYGILVWMIIQNDFISEKPLYYPVLVLLVILSLFVIKVTPLEKNSDCTIFDYSASFEELEKSDNRSIAMHLDLMDCEESFSIVSSLPGDYGILLYTDESQINISKPEFIFSLNELNIKGYSRINPLSSKGYLYLKTDQ